MANALIPRTFWTFPVLKMPSLAGGLLDETILDTIPGGLSISEDDNSVYQVMYFKDRVDVGKRLASLLEKFKGRDVVVYALPRGGVVTAREIARAIHAPLDLIITRKIGHPNQPEYAIGAVAENGHSVFNKEEVLDIDESYLTSEAEKQEEEAKRRRKIYLEGKKPIPCKDKIAILVDDGIATGLTMKAAILELQMHYHPSRIIAAVPIAPEEIGEELERMGVEFVSLDIEGAFLGSIGAYYQDFSPVEDEDVIRIMKEAEDYGRIPVPTA